MKGAGPINLSSLRERRLADLSAKTVVSTPTVTSTQSIKTAEIKSPERIEDVQIHTAVTSTHLRYNGMLNVEQLMCTCGTLVAVHDPRGKTVKEFQAAIGSKRPCCVRFFTLLRITFCSDFDIKIGPQSQEAATRKTIKIAAVVKKPIE